MNSWRGLLCLPSTVCRLRKNNDITSGADRDIRPCILQIDRWVHIVDILLIQLLAQQLHRFAKALEVIDLPLTQELDYVINIRIIAEP